MCEEKKVVITEDGTASAFGVVSEAVEVPVVEEVVADVVEEVKEEE
jgi:hypothetical protein